MSESDAQKVVLAVVVVTGAVVAWDNVKKTGKASGGGGKQLVSFSLLAGALAVGASVAPGIAGPFAVLVGLAVVISRIGTTGSSGTGTTKRIGGAN